MLALSSNIPSMNLRFVYLLLGIIALLPLAMPIDEKWFIPCPFHQLTGMNCPFCGGQRMIRALLQADFIAAFSYNPFLICSLPLFSIWIARYMFPLQIQRIHYLSQICTDRTFFLYLLTALFWGLVRNL